MSTTETRYEEYTVELCDTCGHEQGSHYPKPERVPLPDGAWYIASGCMSLRGKDGRILEGHPMPNPYPRCHCTEFK